MPKNELFPRVLEVVRSVRPILTPHFGKAKAIRHKETGNNWSAVTEFDEAVEQHLIKELSALDSSIGFVGEEGGGDRRQNRFWLSDPIDGTVAFIEGKPYCTTMLALVEDGGVQFSVIYDFLQDILYHAERGKGAFKNGETIHVSNRGPKEASVVMESRLERPKDKEAHVMLRNQYNVVSNKVAGHEFVLVATGEWEARICSDSFGKDYDFAPGTLLVEEAGGIVANIGKTTYDYRNLDFIAANKPVFEALTRGPNAVFPIEYV